MCRVRVGCANLDYRDTQEVGDLSCWQLLNRDLTSPGPVHQNWRVILWRLSRPCTCLRHIRLLRSAQATVLGVLQHPGN